MSRLLGRSAAGRGGGGALAVNKVHHPGAGSSLGSARMTNSAMEGRVLMGF